MNEIEVKILEIDAEDVQKKLKQFGAKKIFDGAVSWTMFAHYRNNRYNQLRNN